MTNSLKRPKIFNDRWEYAREIPAPQSSIRLDIGNLVSMGSCFSRNVIRWINHRKTGQKLKPLWDILYNPFSIEKEFERIWENSGWEKYLLEEISGQGERRYRDPWRSWHVFSGREKLKSQNRLFDQKARKKIEKATGFLFTLGLSEVWSPEKNQKIILNQVPIGSIRLGKQKFIHRFATVAENRRSLKRLVGLIRKRVGKSVPIIFSLSPIPLKYTASGLPVREANNISKATLLLAVQKICHSDPRIDYFPSYEMVQALIEKNPGAVWQKDGRHVTANLIDNISQKFLTTYRINLKQNSKLLFWVPLLSKKGDIVGKQYVKR